MRAASHELLLDWNCTVGALAPANWRALVAEALASMRVQRAETQCADRVLSFVVVPIAGADKGSFEGSATLTDAQAEELMAGKWYVNIHTAANKAGEIRGQVVK